MSEILNRTIVLFSCIYIRDISNPVLPKLRNFFIGNAMLEIAHYMVVPISVALSTKCCKILEILIVTVYTLNKLLKLSMCVFKLCKVLVYIAFLVKGKC